MLTLLKTPCIPVIHSKRSICNGASCLLPSPPRMNSLGSGRDLEKSGPENPWNPPLFADPGAVPRITACWFFHFFEKITKRHFKGLQSNSSLLWPTLQFCLSKSQNHHVLQSEGAHGTIHVSKDFSDLQSWWELKLRGDEKSKLPPSNCGSQANHLWPEMLAGGSQVKGTHKHRNGCGWTLPFNKYQEIPIWTTEVVCRQYKATPGFCLCHRGWILAAKYKAAQQLDVSIPSVRRWFIPFLWRSPALLIQARCGFNHFWW